MIKTKSGKYLLPFILTAFLGNSLPVLAVNKEQAVKAGFIFNFSKYVTWPESSLNQKKFNLCVIGDDNLNGGLEALYGKLALNRPLVLLHDVQKTRLKDCHIAYITGKKSQLSTYLRWFKDLPVLTVSDAEGFVENGGMIGFVRNGAYVGFEIDKVSADVVGLEISAQLLKLAKKVKGIQ